MLPEIELSEKNVEHPSNRKKCVESARNISILVACKLNGKEKCSSTKTQKGVQSGKALYAIFLQKVLKFTSFCGIIDQRLKSLVFRRFRRYAVTTLLTTV